MRTMDLAPETSLVYTLICLHVSTKLASSGSEEMGLTVHPGGNSASVNLRFLDGEPSTPSDSTEPSLDRLSFEEIWSSISKTESSTAWFSLRLVMRGLAVRPSWIAISSERYKSIAFSFSTSETEELPSMIELILEIARDLESLESRNSETIADSSARLD